MKIVFLCRFSNSFIRERLDLKKRTLRNFVLQFFKHPQFTYCDFAVWVDDFIEEFKKFSDEHEFHIVSPHDGMRRHSMSFKEDGLFYHIYKSDGTLLFDTINAKFHLSEKTDYCIYGRRAAKLIKNINPDVICLCGAENPMYGAAIFNINNIPIFLIPQTFLHSSKRIELGVTSQYRVNFEKKVFAKVDAVSTEDPDIMSFAKTVNPDVIFCGIGFPTHKPIRVIDERKRYDFVFFAKSIAEYKGIEETIEALAIVKESHPNVILAIIGGCTQEYHKKLDDLIATKGLEKNIRFLGLFPSRDEMYRNVQKARISVLPGITASLNSTVREAMYMKVPPIVFNNDTIDKINEKGECICAAKMQDISELAYMMNNLLDDINEFVKYQKRGFEYASSMFDNRPIVEKMMLGIKSIVDCG